MEDSVFVKMLWPVTVLRIWIYLAVGPNNELSGVPLAFFMHALMSTGQCPELPSDLIPVIYPWLDSLSTMTTRSKTQGKGSVS